MSCSSSKYKLGTCLIFLAHSPDSSFFFFFFMFGSRDVNKRGSNIIKSSYSVNDRCRAGVFDVTSAGVSIHTVRAGSPTTPNTAVLWVGSLTPAAVWPTHWTVEQSHWNRRAPVRKSMAMHSFNQTSKPYFESVTIELRTKNEQLSFVDSHTDLQKDSQLHALNGTHHADHQRCRWGSCFFSSHWS